MMMTWDVLSFVHLAIRMDKVSTMYTLADASSIMLARRYNSFPPVNNHRLHLLAFARTLTATSPGIRTQRPRVGFLANLGPLALDRLDSGLLPLQYLQSSLLR